MSNSFIEKWIRSDINTIGELLAEQLGNKDKRDEPEVTSHNGNMTAILDTGIMPINGYDHKIQHANQIVTALGTTDGNINIANAVIVIPESDSIKLKITMPVTKNTLKKLDRIIKEMLKNLDISTQHQR